MLNSHIKEAASAFDIPLSTLKKWKAAPNRKAHIHLLNFAVIGQPSFMTAHKLSVIDINTLADELGFGSDALKVDIEGIPKTTWISWNKNEKYNLIKAFLVGMHFKLLEDLRLIHGLDDREQLMSLASACGIDARDLISAHINCPDIIRKIMSFTKTSVNN